MSEVSFDVLDSQESAYGPETRAEQSAAKVIAEALHKHYPPPKGIGFWWAVQVDARNGVAYIWNLALSATHGYTLFLTSLCGADAGQRLMRVGGEMLERARLPRDPRHLTKERVRELERTVRGNIKRFM